MLRNEQIAGLIVLPIALIGAFANWTVAFLVQSVLKNSFGRLTASQSIGDAFHSTIFAFVFAPMCVLNIGILQSNSSVIGHLLLIAYDISTYSHLCISLNRFFSIVAPVNYDTIFSQGNTRVLIIFSWACAICPTFYLYVYNDCKFYYTNDFFAFVFLTTPVCNTIVWYADFLKYNSIVTSIVIIDLITVSKVRKFKRRLPRTSAQLPERNNKAEIKFLKQACLQAFVFTCELITYFLITPKVNIDQTWLRFGLSTVAWVCVHAVDGIITLSFNEEFSRKLFKSSKIRSAYAAETTQHHNPSTTNAGNTTQIQNYII